MSSALPVTVSLSRYLRGLVVQQPLFFLCLCLLGVGAGYLGIAVEYKIKEIIDSIAASDDQLYYLIFLFALYKTIYHSIFFARRLLGIRYMPAILERSVTDIYQRTAQHSLHWFDSHLSGELSNKILDFESGIRELVRSTFGLIHAVVTVLVALVFLISINTKTALVLFFFVIIYVPVIAVLLRYQLQLHQSMTTARQKVVGIINDSIANIFAVKVIANVESEFRRKLQPAIASWRAADRKVRFGDAWVIDSIDTLMVVCMSAAQIYLLAVLLQGNEISAGDFAFVAIITLNIHKQLEKCIDLLLVELNPSIAKIKASLQRVCEPVDVVDKKEARTLATAQGRITFENVRFGYGDSKRVLDLSLVVAPGERLGIVGTTGAGKTTLVKCLLRYFDVRHGSIYLDDVPIQDLTQDSLRAQISIIPQDIAMFHRSIRDNILLACPDASEEALQSACRKARIHDDIVRMPDQYDTVVGERGVKLSGGQRQRVAIARALLKTAPILILDEATSSLDSVTEQLIQESLHEILQDTPSTVIAIAHRLSTLKNMDRIIVMDQGQIVEVGTHQELLEKDGVYKRLWDMQVL